MRFNIVILFLNFILTISIKRNCVSRIVNGNNNEIKPKLMFFGHEISVQNSIKKIANYETGRALMMAYYKDLYKVKKVSLKPSEYSKLILNGMIEYDELFKGNEMTKEIIKKQLIVKMAGQAAITIYYGKKIADLEETKDYKEADKIAKDMIIKYNLINSNVFYDLYYHEYFESKLMEEKSATERVNRIAKRVIQDAYFEAMQILLFRKEKMDILVEELLEKREIEGEIYNIYMEKNEIKSDLDREY